MRILVTGGMGFIGSHFARSAISRGHTVSIVDKMTYAGCLENVEDIKDMLDEIIILDIASPEMLPYLHQRNFDLVVNFAAESHVDRSISNALDFSKSNVLGVVNILEAQKVGSFQKLIQISTDEVYGTVSEGSWTEDSPLQPRSPYSASKASAELHCNAYATTFDLDITITRCANNYGPRQSVEKLIPVAITKLSAGKKVPVYGDGKNIREWIHVEDHVNAIILLAESNQSGTFNIGGDACSNLEIVSKLCNLMNMGEDRIEFISDRLGHDFRYSVNDDLLTSKLGWKRNWGLELGLEETINWYLSNQNWVAESLERVAR